MGQHVAHWVHLVITITLFGVNLILTLMISKEDFSKRLRYIGHEMAFLSIGIAASRVFNINAAIVFISVMIYIFIWVLTLWLTQQVIDAGKVLVPQMGVTIALGCVSVYLSAAGILEHFFIPILKTLNQAAL